MTTSSQQRTHEHWIARILAAGVWTSATLLLAGLLFVVAGSGSAVPPDHNPSLAALIHRLANSDFYSGNAATGITLMYLGLVALILTPFLRVLTAAVTFVLERDWRYTVVSMLVFLALIGELIFTYR